MRDQQDNRAVQPALLRVGGKKSTMRYVYRSRHYQEPPADWPAPTGPCRSCARLADDLRASWRWNGYHYECSLHDDEGEVRKR